MPFRFNIFSTSYLISSRMSNVVYCSYCLLSVLLITIIYGCIGVEFVCSMVQYVFCLFPIITYQLFVPTCWVWALLSLASSLFRCLSVYLCFCFIVSCSLRTLLPIITTVPNSFLLLFFA